MSRELEFSSASAALLETYLPPSQPPGSTRPFVTLTYAQSLDASIALEPGVRTRLSGPESKSMTHYLRSHHAAILVGVSTMLADDPALNCRIAGASSQPRPIVVDPQLRWTPARGDKVLETCRAGAGLAPYVLTAVEPAGLPAASVELLREHGGKYISLPAELAAPAGRLRFDWRHVFDALHAEGLASVMVEGGGQIISSLLDARNHNQVDSVIITIAPTWLGQGGVLVSPQATRDEHRVPLPAARLSRVQWHPFGDDVVLCGKLYE
ncbi:2,5-diamino-6-ribosylamino-4(3H)-pyrimidinone 5'-phosphate reductase [Paramyrothecium foliicola]|nr:2,5-diamino-6-ribosylamino-4(3H)-pyrimidinone 5'-phosphate reductase [Paramyrothecium foliicola]